MLALLLIPLTSLASILHGGNWKVLGMGKGFWMVLHALACCLCLLAMGTPLPWAWLGLIPSAIFWFIYRSGKIARAELTCVRYPDEDNFDAVWKAYILPNVITTALAGGLLLYTEAVWWFLALMPLWAGLEIPYIAVKRFNHARRPDLKRLELDAYAQRGHADRIWDCRRYQELITGGYAGYAVALLLYAIHAAIGAYLNASV